MKKKFFQFVVFFSTLTIFSNVFATSANFSWLPNTESNINGYIVYYGTNSRNYTFQKYVDNQTTNGRIQCSVTGLANDTLYYFAVTAYNNDGESDYSWELTYLTPPLDTTTSFPTWTVYLDSDNIQDTVYVDNDGVYVIYGSDTTTENPILIMTDFALSHGWDPTKHKLNIVDINNDGVLDFYGIGDHGVRIAYGIDGYSFEQSYVVLSEFGYSDGWRIEHRRVFTDVNIDGFQDVSGWKDGAHWVSLSVNGEDFENIVSW